jgi:multiple sugar transport system ATP-binding protein
VAEIVLDDVGKVYADGELLIARTSRRLETTTVGCVGSPPMNLVRGVFTWATGRLSVLLGGQLLPVDPVLLEIRPGLARYAECPVVVGIRPEDMQDPNVGWRRSSAVLMATVDSTEAFGSHLLIRFRIPAREVLNIGERAPVAPRPGVEVVARFSRRSRARAGASIHIAIDTARLHVFDLNTGRSVW